MTTPDAVTSHSAHDDARRIMREAFTMNPHMQVVVVYSDQAIDWMANYFIHNFIRIPSYKREERDLRRSQLYERL